jgi:alkylation response protein AidB-like acyl-CoA dehydrogenase
VADGYRVKGRWPFASGCTHADWIGGFCIVTENGKPVPGPQGKPLLRVVVLPARDWEIEDTWHAAGLKGTGSHHVTLRETLVPEANFFDLDAARASRVRSIGRCANGCHWCTAHSR